MSELDADWLRQDMDQASSDYAMAFAPGQSGLADEHRLGERDAMLLRGKLVERYREWTGRDLLSDLGSDPHRPDALRTGEEVDHAAT